MLRDRDHGPECCEWLKSCVMGSGAVAVALCTCGCGPVVRSAHPYAYGNPCKVFKHPGVLDIRGRSDFSRFDPRPERPHFTL